MKLSGGSKGGQKEKGREERELVWGREKENAAKKEEEGKEELLEEEEGEGWGIRKDVAKERERIRDREERKGGHGMGEEVGMERQIVS